MSLLRSHRNFRLLWLGQTVSSSGSAVTLVALPLTALGVLHASTFAVAALTSAEYLPTLLIGLLVGAWSIGCPSARSCSWRTASRRWRW